MNGVMETRDLTVDIGGKSVCRGLNLRIAAGESWAVLGPNGSGKTTLLHTLTGLRPAVDGGIWIKERPLREWPTHALAREIGTLLQTQDDPFPSTVLETVLIGRHPHLQRWQWETDVDRQRAALSLAAVDLSGFESRLLSTLSGGERRRAAIATVLCQNPALFALDEPINHLDLHHQAKVLALFSRLAKSDARTLVMVLHDVTSAARYCDHALLLYGGGETAAGSITEMLTEENLERLYNHRLHRMQGPDGEVWVPAYIG